MRPKLRAFTHRIAEEDDEREEWPSSERQNGDGQLNEQLSMIPFSIIFGNQTFG
jgi:hypothetical protein